MTQSQQYANIVFTNVEQLIKNENNDILKRYKSLCKRSGGMLRTVGLIQFLVFLSSKASKTSEIHHQFLLDNLYGELKQQDVIKNINSSSDLINVVRKQNLPDYMYTSTQVLKFLQWHKRVADMLIEGEQ